MVAVVTLTYRLKSVRNRFELFYDLFNLYVLAPIQISASLVFLATRKRLCFSVTILFISIDGTL